MADDQTDARAVFAAQLASGLVSALVIKGLLSKAEASALVTDALDSAIETAPESEQLLREIAGAVTAGIGLTSIAFDRAKDRG